MSDKAKLVKRLEKILSTALADQIAEEVVDSLWLAEHDAEVRQEQADHDAIRINDLDTRLVAAERELAEARAGVVAEEPEWAREAALHWLEAGCEESLTITRKLACVGEKKSGWLVMYGTDDDGTDDVDVVLTFCPECAAVVRGQQEGADDA